MKVDKRLYQIAPFWAAKLERIRSITGIMKKYPMPNLSTKELDMVDYSFCVVGEAYGFSQIYKSSFGSNKCKTCELFSNSFNREHVMETTEEAIPRFEKLIIDFCNHVEKVHGI